MSDIPHDTQSNQEPQSADPRLSPGIQTAVAGDDAEIAELNAKVERLKTGTAAWEAARRAQLEARSPEPPSSNGLAPCLQRQSRFSRLVRAAARNKKASQIPEGPAAQRAHQGQADVRSHWLKASR